MHSRFDSTTRSSRVDTRARATAHARVSSPQGFPILRHALGTQKVFAGFALVCLAAWFFILKFVPETKGTSLEQAGQVPPDK